MATVTENITAMTQMINDAGLGPAELSVVPAPGEHDAVQVDMDVRLCRKSQNLVRWLGFLDVRDAVAGKFRAADTTVRLSVRGLTPHGVPIIVVATYDETTERAATDLIAAEIQRQDVPGLVARLAALETHN